MTTNPNEPGIIHGGNPFFEGKPSFLVRDYPIQLHAIGPDGRLRLGAGFDLMQDIAGAHAALLGIGLPDLRRLGITWVLSRLMLKFDGLPPNCETVRVTTWPSGVHRLFAMRQFELTDPCTGGRIGTASSFWLMLKLSNLRPVAPEDVTGEFPANQDRPIFFEDWGKLDGNAGCDPVRTEIGQSKIDYNNHVNNSYYAMFAQDWLAVKCGCAVHVDSIRINFNFALRLFDSIICTGEADGSHFRVAGHTEAGKNVFAADGTYSRLELE